MERRSALAVAATIAVAAAALFTLSADAQGPPAGHVGFFNSPCGYTHRATDDPIVFPGRPGASHSHDFFGNPSTDSGSTLQSLTAVAGGCRNPADHAGYWVPTLFKGARIVAPLRANVYYRTAGREPASIEPFPAGLRVIAGDSKATAPQDQRVVHWGCTGEVDPLIKRHAPVCPAGTNLRLSIVFPDCWNGRDLDSSDHKAHLTYATHVRGGGRACPASHPHAVPSLVLNVAYATRGGRGLMLASGSIDTAHGDFFNAWEPAELGRLVRECLNADVHCAPPPRAR